MFKCKHANCKMDLPTIILLLLRIFVGVIFILHGMSKATNLTGFSGLIEALSIPLPIIVAGIIAYFEIIGGAFIALGLWNRIIGFIFALEILAVILIGLLSKAMTLPAISIEYNSLLLLLSLYLAATAKNACHIGCLFSNKKETPTV